MRMSRSLVISLVLHAVLFLAALFFLHPRSTFIRPVSTSPVLIEVVESSTSAKTSTSGGASSSHKQRERPLPQLKDLGVFSQSGAPKSHASSYLEEHTEGTEGQGAESPFGFENQVTGKSSPVLSYVFHHVDQFVAFPQEFKDAGISGEVSGKINFDAQGKWVPSPADFHGNPYLRIYILQRLRNSFADSIPEKIWNADPHPLTVDVHFIFEVVAPETVVGAQTGPQFAPSADPTKFNTTDMDGGQSIERQVIAKKQGMYGRKFQFYRVFLSSPLDWKFGPFAGYGIMPTVGIDPGWFVDTVKNIIHPKVKIDPLDHYRDDPDW
jgi:hypothetical protein